MHDFCPNCSYRLTDSSVGSLCLNCGAVHKFYNQGGQTSAITYQAGTQPLIATPPPVAIQPTQLSQSPAPASVDGLSKLGVATQQPAAAASLVNPPASPTTYSTPTVGNQSQIASQTKKQKGRLVIISLAAIVVLAILAAGAYYLLVLS